MVMCRGGRLLLIFMSVYVSVVLEIHGQSRLVSKVKDGVRIASPTTGAIHHTTTMTCSDGFWLEGTRCVSKTEVPYSYICPAGTSEQRGACKVFSPMRFTCSDASSVLVGEECITKVTASKELFCQAGATLINRECSSTLDAPAVCPDGTALTGDRCAAFHPVQKTCPAGYMQSGLVCAKTVSTEPTVLCAEGLTLEAHMCVATTDVQPVCPKGSVSNGDGCAAYLPKVPNCPPDFLPINNGCIRTWRVSKQPRCANGADPTDECRVVVVVPYTPTCPTNGQLINGNCETPKAVMAQYSCPTGYTINSTHWCTKAVDYDCSTTTHEIECDSPPSSLAPSNIRSLAGADLLPNILSSKKDGNPKGSLIKGNSQQPTAVVLPVCHKVSLVSQKTCQRMITAEAAPHCADGGVYKGGDICEEMSYTSPVIKCTARTDEHGNCFVEETSPPISDCPAGFSEGSDDSCVRTESSPILMQCPAGSTGPSCAVYQDKVCPEGGCQKLVSELPTIVCPEGFMKSSPSPDTGENGKNGLRPQKRSSGTLRNPIAANQHKSQCTKTEFSDLANVCPAGTEQISGVSCASYFDVVAETKTRRAAAKERCPEGYSEGEGDQCVMSSVSAASPTCQTGSHEDGLHCSMLVPKNQVCPKGAVEEGGLCWITRTSDPLLVQTVVEDS